MNRIEEKMALLQEKKEKAFITYITAGLPDMEGTKALIKAQKEAGVDVIELGIPFSDPIADGPVIQDASYRSICLGTNITKVFRMMEEIRQEGVDLPIIFMMYYNTILHYGIQAFAAKCKETGVDGLIVPDLPLEEQEELKAALAKQDGAILIQLVVTGQAGSFHKEVLAYLSEVKQISKIPVMMGFGIRTPEDIAPMKDVIDGAIVGTYFMQLLEEHHYSVDAAKKYCRDFKVNLG